MSFMHSAARGVSVLALLLLMSACGGGGGGAASTSGSVTTPPPGGGTGSGSNPPPANTSVQFNLGDGPADRLAGVNLSITGMTITDAAGTVHTVLASSTPIEMMSLMGNVRPMALTSLPQGTYSSMAVTIASGTVLYMDPASGQLVQRTVTGPMTANIRFSPNMTVGSTPGVVNLDMDMANSIAIDAAGGVTLTPMMNVSVVPAQVSSHDPWYGGLDHMMGTVGTISGSSFQLTMMQGYANIPVAVNASTQFTGMSGMGMMQNGWGVRVNAALQPDGTLVATSVQSIMGNTSGAMGYGLVTALSGAPLSQITLALQDGFGNGMMSSYFGGTVTVNVTGTTAFQVDSDHVDLSNLPFTPTFDATTVSKGQALSLVSGSSWMCCGMGGGMMGGGGSTVQTIWLEQQGLRGSVSAYSSTGSQSTFILTVPSDSVFAQLAGTTTIVVYQQPGTELRGLSAISAGDTVRVRGLVFRDGLNYRLVASRILGP